MNRGKFVLLFVGLVILGALLAFSALNLTRPFTFAGSKIDPPAVAVDFTLTDQNGLPYTLSEHRGKVILLFFGYTNCPDVCPTTLAEFKRVHEMLGDRASSVEFLFITVDPERDTVQRIAEYLPTFGSAITGLTGTEKELASVWQNFWIFRAPVDVGSAAGYLVDHSSRAYAIDPQGLVRVTYYFGSSPDALTRDTLYLLGES